MSLLKTQIVCDDGTDVEEKNYRNDHDDKSSDCVRRLNTRSTVENSDVRDFHLRGYYYIVTKMKYLDIYA